MEDGCPEKPSDQDCCHNGCSPCVFDVYEKRLAEWKKKTRSESFSFRLCTDLLSETVFKPFVLKSKIKEGKDAWLIKFQALSDKLEGRIPYRAGQHVVLRHPGNDGDKIVTRDYTLIPFEESDDEPCCFTVVIKLYDQGVMSSYIGGLELGSVVQFRGPAGDFNYVPNSFDQVLMICMGTGVVPMYAVAKEIVDNESDETFVKLLYGCRSVDSLILRDRLHRMLSFWNYRSWYCFSDGIESVENKSGESFVLGRINEELVLAYLAPFEHCLVLICGNETFNVDMKEIFCKLVPEENIFIF